MLSETQARQAIGSTAYDNDGDKIGKVGQLFLDDETGQPEFVTVNTGLFGTKETFIPVGDATFDGDRLVLPFDKDKVKNAPNVDAEGGHLDRPEEQRLYEYYGMGYGTSTGRTTGDATGNADLGTGVGNGLDTDRERAGFADTDTSNGTDARGGLGTAGTGTAGTGTAGTGTAGTGTGTGRDTDLDSDLDAGRGTVGHDTSGPTTDEAMTRSEEQLQVDKTRQESGRARLRKYVTTENETVTVPVQKERAVLETEPITDANVGDATSGPAISEEEHEVVLSEEHVDVQKTATPVERVRLGKESVTENETVSEQVRKEHIEAEGDVTDRRS
jgi:uncharacterized protein (TIGR02271 family)